MKNQIHIFKVFHDKNLAWDRIIRKNHEWIGDEMGQSLGTEECQ